MEFLKPFAWNLTGDKYDAEDLIQDTLYRALVNKDKFQDDTNIGLGCLLSCVTYSLIITVIKRNL